MKSPGLVAVRVWDLPTRLFHWSLAILVLVSFVSAKIGGDAMEWHFRSGYALFALLGFRLVWGICGGHWSRFSQFIFSPFTLFRYVSGKTQPGQDLDVGHSPTGALAVFAMFAVLAAQVGTGLLADDELSNAGPLVNFVNSVTTHLATAWHTTWGQWALIAMIGLHVTAILYYTLLKRRRLIVPMLGGDKLLPAGTPASTDDARTRILALILLSGCAAGVGYIVSLGS